MCYTSGTTGRPKGVVYSHRSLVLHSLVAALPDVNSLSPRDTVLPVVPMFHANAWGLIYTAALVGSGLVLPGPKLDAVSVLDLLAGERVTMTAGVPTVWMAVLGGDRRGARPLGPERAARARRRGLGGAAQSARGLRPPRPDDRPRLGDDRDLAAGQRLPAAGRARRRARGGPVRLPRAPGHRVAVRRDPSSRRRRRAGRLGRRGDGRARGPRSVGGARLPPRPGRREVHRRRLVPDRRRGQDRRRAATSASATAPRTSSSPAGSGSPRSTSRTC